LSAVQPIHWRKYGEATVIPLSLTRYSDAATMNWGDGTVTLATGDCLIASWDSGTSFTSAANSTNLPNGTTTGSPLLHLSLTASEMSHKQVFVTVRDQSDDLIHSATIPIVTFGHASAMYPFDLSSSIGSISIAPIQANVVSSLMVTTDISVYQTAESPALTWTVLDANNVPIDLSTATLSFKVYNTALTTIFSKTTSSGITVSGSSSNIVTATYTATDTATAGGFLYMLWRTDGSDTPLAAGKFTILPAVK